MPFRFSGIFEPIRPPSSKQDVSTNFKTTTVFQLHEVISKPTEIPPVPAVPADQDLPALPAVLTGPAIISPPLSRRKSRVDRTMTSVAQRQSMLPKQINNVKNVLSEYCFALDNKHYDRLSKLFAPNCLAYYNAVAPPQGSKRHSIQGYVNTDTSNDGTSGLRGRDAVVAFLRSRVHDKTTMHLLSTQHLEFEYEGGNGDNDEGAIATACIAKTYFTANTFSMPSRHAPDAPLVHTVQYGQYVDVLRPGAANGLDGWEIHHRRVIVMVPRLIQPSMLANGSHEDVEERLIQHQQRHRHRQRQHQQQLQQRQQHQYQQQYQQESVQQNMQQSQPQNIQQSPPQQQNPEQDIA